MKFHFMLRGLDSNITYLRDITKKASDSGFYSMLLTYHSRQEDFWIKSARIIDDSIPMKMMIAIRTYAISPEYCAMMVAASNSIAKNKIVLNVVAGDLHKDETSVNDVIAINDLIATSQDRVEYTTKWLEKFTSLDLIKNQIPEIVISGTSEKSINNLINYGDCGLAMLDYYTVEKKEFPKNKRWMAATEIKLFKDNDNKKWTLSGNKKEILEKIIDIENIGVTDLLISCDKDQNLDELFSLIKEVSHC
jgi:hypothetical protein